MRLLQVVVVVRVVSYRQLGHVPPGLAVFEQQVSHFHVVELVAAALGFQRHSKGGVFDGFNGPDGVHNDADFHYSSLSQIAQLQLQGGDGSQGRGFGAQYPGA